MDTELQQQIAQRAAALPAVVKKAIAEGNLPEKIASLGRKYRLMIDQLDVLDTEISLVILGFTRPDKLDEALITHVGMEKEQAYAMVGDINKEILAPIRETLMGMHQSSENLPETHEELSRESVLSDIENPTPLRAPTKPLAPSQTPNIPTVTTSPTLSRPVATPLSPEKPAPLTKPTGLGSSFVANKLSGTFAAGLPPRPIAAPTIKTMPKSPAEAAAAKTTTSFVTPTPVSKAAAQPSIPAMPKTPVIPPAPAVQTPVPQPVKPLTAVAMQPTPFVSAPKSTPAPTLSSPKSSITPSVPATSKPGLADAIRSALPNLGATATMQAPTPKVIPQPSIPVAPKAPAQSIEPLAKTPNPLAGIPSEKSANPTVTSSATPRSSDPYREPIN